MPMMLFFSSKSRFAIGKPAFSLTLIGCNGRRSGNPGSGRPSHNSVRSYHRHHPERRHRDQPCRSRRAAGGRATSRSPPENAFGIRGPSRSAALIRFLRIRPIKAEHDAQCHGSAGHCTARVAVESSRRRGLRSGGAPHRGPCRGGMPAIREHTLRAVEAVLHQRVCTRLCHRIFHSSSPGTHSKLYAVTMGLRPSDLSWKYS